MQQPKRKYNKKSQYWDNLSQPKNSLPNFTAQSQYEPELCGEPFYVSSASIGVSKASYSRSTDTERSSSRIIIILLPSSMADWAIVLIMGLQ